MKNDSILIIGALAAGGYLIYKSNIAGGLGEAVGGVGSGIGSAVGGVGAGIGDIATGFASGVNSVFDFINPLGAFGNQVAANINASGEIRESSLRREAGQEEYIDVQSFDQASPQLTNIQTQKDIFGAEQNLLRSQDWESTKTDLSDFGTNLISPSSWASAGSKLVTYSPAGKIASWVSSVSKSLKSSITGNAINSPTASTSASTGSTSSSSGSSGSIRTAKQDKFLESLGYQGQSTKSGIVYTKPTTISFPSPTQSIRAPVKKKWWNPFD